MVPNHSAADLLFHTANIVCAHVSNNPVASGALPALIRSVYASLSSGNAGETDAAPTASPIPAVPIKRSVFPDYIVSLEDGRKFKMLKRYLFARHGMTPEQYREKWGLPTDYPMVAPNYAVTRSGLAKRAGLGRKREETPDLSEPRISKLPARRARGTKG